MLSSPTGTPSSGTVEPVPSSSSHSSFSPVSSPVNRNPHLQFEKSDIEYIPLPVARTKLQMAQILLTLVEDSRVYPWKTYRMLDYFRTAVQMFIREARQEYRLQHQGALRNGRPLTRFTWRNKGELAICFACVCDMLKLLYDRLRPGPLKPMWDDLVEQLAPLLMRGSRIPAAVLSANTYHTKFMDWQKGGTRYGGESSRANVRFPSVSERQVKVETFLKSGVGYNIQAVVVDPSMIGSPMYPVNKPRPSPVATPSLAPGASPSSSASSLSSLSNFSSVPLGVGGGVTSSLRHFPLRPGGRMTEHGGSGSSSGQGSAGGSNVIPPSPPRQIPEEMRHLYWLAALAHIKGGEPTACFPDSRAPLMIAFGKLCEMSKSQEERLALVHIIRGSSPGIHTIMERLGGLISFRQFAAVFIAEGDSAGLMLLVDTVARLRTPCWTRHSQEAWCTDVHHKRGHDLQWLRQLSMIPTDKRAAWGALLLMMEEKFIFTLPLEEVEARRQKQMQEASVGLLSSPTSVSLATAAPSSSVMGSLNSMGLQAATADNKIHMRNWKWPRLHTFYARRLPDEWRAPMFLNEKDEATVNAFLEKRQAFLDDEQERWKMEILGRIALAQAGHNVSRGKDGTQLLFPSTSMGSTPLDGMPSINGEDEKKPLSLLSNLNGSNRHTSNFYPSPDTAVPLWYDPLALLGVSQPLKIDKKEEL